MEDESPTLIKEIVCGISGLVIDGVQHIDNGYKNRKTNSFLEKYMGLFFIVGFVFIHNMYFMMIFNVLCYFTINSQLIVSLAKWLVILFSASRP